MRVFISAYIFLSSYKQSQSGATALEYAIFTGAISFAIVAIIFALGDDIELIFDTFHEYMSDVLNDADNDTADAES